MIILNFSHPLTAKQRAQIERLTGQTIEEVRALSAQVDVQKPLTPQIERLVGRTGLTPEAWQTLPLLLVLPALNFSAVVLVAYLHGLMGYFPAIVRLRPIADAVPPRYEVAEIINLQAVRERGRQKR